MERCASLSCSAGGSAIVTVAAAGADQYTAAAGEFVDSLEGSRFASRRRRCRTTTTGTGTGLASDKTSPRCPGA
jgi:hypothetical protein